MKKDKKSPKVKLENLLSENEREFSEYKGKLLIPITNYEILVGIKESGGYTIEQPDFNGEGTHKTFQTIEETYEYIESLIG